MGWYVSTLVEIYCINLEQKISSYQRVMRFLVKKYRVIEWERASQTRQIKGNIANKKYQTIHHLLTPIHRRYRLKI